MINRGHDGDGDYEHFYGELLDELKARHITYSIDDYNVLRVFVGNRIWFECQDVKEDTQALDIIGDELPNLKEN